MENGRMVSPATDPVPAREIAGIREADAKLLATIQGLDDDAVRRPSLLPRWTVGHVLTHIARNGDSVVRRLEGCVRSEVADQYEGGAEGRADEIEAGASRSAAELLDDVETALISLAAGGDEPKPMRPRRSPAPPKPA